jgi:hypothetical protein
MAAATGNASRRLHWAMTELVATFLLGEGFNAKAKPVHRRISSSLDYALVPDVDGIPGVYLDVSARGDHRLSADLDSVREGAAVAGYPVSVLVQHRAGRGVDEAYAVMTLSDFAKLSRAAEPISASP